MFIKREREVEREKEREEKREKERVERTWVASNTLPLITFENNLPGHILSSYHGWFLITHDSNFLFEVRVDKGGR